MKAAAQQFLVDRASPAGTLACGLRQPGGKYICHSVDETCPAGKLEKILGQFENLRAALSAEKLAPHWNTWAFERGQIRFVERPDGWLLALVIRSESEALPGLDALSLEFLSLDLGQ
jgi:hypothetical protein